MENTHSSSEGHSHDHDHDHGHDHEHSHDSAPVQAKPVMHFDAKDIADNKIMAALSYLGILCLIPLLAKKDSKFCQENGRQGLIVFLIWIVLGLFMYFPLLGFVARLACIVLTIADIIALVKTLMGEFWEIPVIGQYRNKINL